MTGLELETAFYADMGRALRDSELKSFLLRGVSPASLVTPDMIVPALVHFYPPERFCLPGDMREPGELSGAFLILCRDEAGDAIDVAAWRPSDDAVATMNGVAWCLGEDWLAEPYHVLRDDGALVPFRSPLAWLQAERRGIYVLDYRRAAYALRHHYPVFAEDFQHADALENALTIRPRIVIPSIEDRIAA